MIRQPIIAVVGHVDHGKTTLLDFIRGSNVAMKEAGGITQHIGATEVPLSTIKNLAGKLLEKYSFNLKIPGLLFIDTPGHEAFTTLRERGTSIADLAILIIDITKGFQPQTYEALEILKKTKTPFVVALNKVDLLPNWKTKMKNIKTIGDAIKKMENEDYEILGIFEEKTYDVIKELKDKGFNADRFDRVKDFRNTVLIIPISALTGFGIPELLLFLAGLSQRFLEKKLETNPKEKGKATILEVKEVPGMGTTIDVILYSGKLKARDLIALESKDGKPIITKIRALLKPKPLEEIRDTSKFVRINEVVAAAGIKIAAPHLENALPGGNLYVIENEEEGKKLIKEITKKYEKKLGVVLKADTTGSIDGLKKLLKKENIPFAYAEIGNVSKKDVMEANAIKEKNKYYGAVLGFNVDVDPLAESVAKDLDVMIFTDKVIYKLVEKYKEWVEKEKEKEELKLLEELPSGVEFQVLPGFVFRKSKPLIVGVRVLRGRLKEGLKIKNRGKEIGKVKSIQKEGKNIKVAKEGDEVAVAIDGATYERHVKEGDVLYSLLSFKEIEKLLKLKHRLSKEEYELLLEMKKKVI